MMTPIEDSTTTTTNTTMENSSSTAPQIRKTASAKHNNGSLDDGGGSSMSGSSYRGTSKLNNSSNNNDTTLPSSTTTASLLTVAAGNADPLLHGHQQLYNSSNNSIPPYKQHRTVLSLQQQQQQHNSSNNIYQLYRFYDVRTMDIQSTIEQMKYLISFKPQYIYKTAYYRKQTKHYWYRDDPSFIILQCILLLLSCIIYCIAFRSTILQSISFIVSSIVWNYLLVGIMIATVLHKFTNQHLLSSSSTTATTTTSHHVQRQQVEWLYAFDIHCNAFFPLFIVLYVVQFFSMPITLVDGFIPLLLANTLYFIGFAWYWYITHLGYRTLPFLHHTEYFLLPIPLLFAIYIFFMIAYPFGFGYNITRVMARFYFI